jgi:hypothetical protein
MDTLCKGDDDDDDDDDDDSSESTNVKIQNLHHGK